MEQDPLIRFLAELGLSPDQFTPEQLEALQKALDAGDLQAVQEILMHAAPRGDQGNAPQGNTPQGNAPQGNAPPGGDPMAALLGGAAPGNAPPGGDPMAALLGGAAPGGESEQPLPPNRSQHPGFAYSKVVRDASKDPNFFKKEYDKMNELDLQKEARSDVSGYMNEKYGPSQGQQAQGQQSQAPVNEGYGPIEGSPEADVREYMDDKNGTNLSDSIKPAQMTDEEIELLLDDDFENNIEVDVEVLEQIVNGEMDELLAEKGYSPEDIEKIKSEAEETLAQANQRDAGGTDSKIPDAGFEQSDSMF